MSTIVCQNIQSCFDTLTLKLNPPNNCYTTTHKPSTQTGWSCIESLSNGLDLCRENGDKLEVYVHPLVKRSASMLSDKSLEMCTENLGSETGSDITEDNDLFSMLTSLDSEGGEESSASRKPPQKKQKEEEKAKKVGYESLPPPLTTMCGAHTVRVRPHRESGRLVMTAVTTTSPRSSIYAERCNGRLTMSLLDDFSDGVAVAEPEVEEEEVSHEIDGGEEEEEYLEELGEEEVLEEGRNGNNKEVGEKFEIGEIQRLRSRCKGGRGSRRYINWETYWVAT